MKKNNLSLENLLTSLRNVNEFKENQSTRIGIYGCQTCDCGSVILWLGYSDDDKPVLNIDLDQQSIKIATDVYNYLNPDQPPMTEQNFLTFLSFVFVK